MNSRWLLIHRLRGPAFLLTFGVTAVLHQWDILGFGQSWPLYLIVAGTLSLAERAAMAGVPVVPYAGAYAAQAGGYPAYPAQGVYVAPGDLNYMPQAPYPQQAGTGVVPYTPVGSTVVDPPTRQETGRDIDLKNGGRF